MIFAHRNSAMNLTAIANLHRLMEAHQIKGFLAEDEAEALYECALSVCDLGPCLEIGSYCGKSTAYIGSACRNSDNILFAVDHHRGSEEHQLGEEYHDPEVYDVSAQRLDTFPSLQKTLEIFALQDAVIPVVTRSQTLARKWATPLGLAFIDGGHSHEQARSDCLAWAQHITTGGLLAIHDIFSDPAQGGQGPYLALQAVLESGRFVWLNTINSLGILRRI
jgi:MMP 1-O-methyltransferase